MSKIRFVIPVQGASKYPLSAESTSSGDLLIFLRGAQSPKKATETLTALPITNYANLKSSGWLSYKENISGIVGQHRFSVHPSKNSAEGINLIKMTKTVDGKNITETIVTHAMKGGDLIQPIFFWHLHDWRASVFKSKPDARSERIDLPECTADWGAILTVAVARNNSKFALPEEVDTGFRRIQASGTDFSIILLWSYVNLPPSLRGGVLTINSVKLLDPYKGVNEKELIGLHREMRAFLLASAWEFQNPGYSTAVLEAAISQIECRKEVMV